MSNTVWKSTKKSWKCAENIINWSQCYSQTNTSNGCVLICNLILDFDILFFILDLDLIVFLYVCISKTLITHQRSRQSFLQKQVQQRFFTKFIVTILISWCRFYPSVWQFCTTSHSLQWIWLLYIFSSWCCLMTFFKKGVESDSSDDSVLWRWNKSKGEKMIILLVVFLRGALSSLWVRGSIQSDEERNKLRISTSLASSCWK